MLIDFAEDMSHNMAHRSDYIFYFWVLEWASDGGDVGDLWIGLGYGHVDEISACDRPGPMEWHIVNFSFFALRIELMQNKNLFKLRVQILHKFLIGKC